MHGRPSPSGFGRTTAGPLWNYKGKPRPAGMTKAGTARATRRLRLRLGRRERGLSDWLFPARRQPTVGTGRTPCGRPGTAGARGPASDHGGVTQNATVEQSAEFQSCAWTVQRSA